MIKRDILYIATLASLILVSDTKPFIKHVTPQASTEYVFSIGRPLDYYEITSPVGFRKAPMGGLVDGMHRGLDMIPLNMKFDKKANVQVKSAERGIATIVYPAPGYYNGIRFRGHPVFGGMVAVYHPDAGIYTLYGHMKEVWVYEGQALDKGTPLGLVGSTGISTGPHLHFEIVVDPDYLLSADEADRAEKYFIHLKAQKYL